MVRPERDGWERSDDGERDALALFEVMDALEGEVAASPLVPGGLIALNAERVTNLTALLREFEAAVRAQPPDERAMAARVKQARAEAVLIVEEARRQAELLLSGKRVDGLRAAEVERLLREGRQHGEALVNAAYADAAARITQTQARADAALHHVLAACDEVREEPPGPARRLAAAVGARAGGAFSRLLARVLGV